MRPATTNLTKNKKMTDTNKQTKALDGSDAPTCSPFWYGVGAFFVAPVAAIFCILMGAMMILAWPFIPFLCYMQKKEEISKPNNQAQARSASSDATCNNTFPVE